MKQAHLNTSSPSDDGTPEVTLRIGAHQRASGSGGSYAHVNPATGSSDGDVPLAGPSEIDEAVSAAHAAFDSWRALSGADRGLALFRLADLIEAHTDEFIELGMRDNGTPRSMVAGSVSAAATWTRYYAGWADKLPLGRVSGQQVSGGEFAYTLRQPYGVIAVIITWNAPLPSLAMKVPAALAAGNTVVVKPSELTPYSAMLFADLVREAGIPDGVVNIVPGGAAAGDALVRHPRVKKVTFTGGPATARKIVAACGEVFKPVVLELGGKSANVIFADADLDKAAGHAVFMGIGAFSGQGCALPTRVLVHSSVYDEFIEKVAANAHALPVGEPHDANVVSGPVVNSAAAERIAGVIDRAHAEGARLVAGGHRLGDGLESGYFFAPTVFADVSPDSDLFRNEVFGPVLSVTSFDTDDEAIALANATDYGLSGYVWTRDATRALWASEQMTTGEVVVNGALNARASRPFGGVGLSGSGREGGQEGLDEFLWTKSVAHAQ